MAVALDGAGHLYVADRDNYRIQELPTAGAFVRQWGSFGTGDGQFSLPRAVWVGTDRLNRLDL